MAGAWFIHRPMRGLYGPIVRLAGQLADTPTRIMPSRGLVNLWTGQLVKGVLKTSSASSNLSCTLWAVQELQQDEYKEEEQNIH